MSARMIGSIFARSQGLSMLCRIALLMKLFYFVDENKARTFYGALQKLASVNAFRYSAHDA